MKTKIKLILSILTLAIFAVLGGGSVDQFINAFQVWLFVMIAFVIVLVIYKICVFNEEDKKREQDRKVQEANRVEKKKILEVETQKLLEEMGMPDKAIPLMNDGYDINDSIMVYENKQIVRILGKNYMFKDILSCTLTDDPYVKKGQLTAETRTKTGSLVTRAVVGDVIAGPVGSIIGGGSAKKNTTFHQEDDTTIHHYMVIININSISKPVIRLGSYRSERIPNEIVGLMNVIINRTKQ